MRSLAFALACCIGFACSSALAAPEVLSCVKSSAGFEACSGTVLALEAFEDGSAGGKPGAWVVLAGMKCTTPRPPRSMFALSNATDERSFAAKLSLAQLAHAQGKTISLVYAVDPRVAGRSATKSLVGHSPPPRVVRVNVPALLICDAEDGSARPGPTTASEPAFSIGAPGPLVGPPTE